MSANITPHPHKINCSDRSAIKGHLPAVLWFTGLSGSGKSTLANHLESRLNKVYQAHTYLLDGDNIRQGLNKDLGFDNEARKENIRRIGEVSKLFFDAGIIVLTAFISPFREDRKLVRESLPEGGFCEIYVRCPIDVCLQRDPKGLYKKAKTGGIQNFTGIDSPYEEPLSPDILIESSSMTIHASVDRVIEHLILKGVIKAK